MLLHDSLLPLGTMLDGLAHERTTAEIRGGIFAAEHLNNNAPIRVTQALLGHATLDTVMVYAKLYLTRLVGEYRRPYAAPTRSTAKTACATRASRSGRRSQSGAGCGHGHPISADRRALLARPGCSGCSHAKPKKSAAPVFRCMLASHRRALAVALDGGEPAGQIAARELEIGRGESASAAPRS